MNTFWLKLAGVVVLIVGLIILVNVFLPSKSEPRPKPKPKTFYDVIESDDQRLRAEPQVEEPNKATKATQGEKVVPAKPQFKELSLEDSVEADKLFEMALAQRKMGRLPGMSYKLMVDYCREIIERWPESVYAFKARRMLGEVPRRYWNQYGITDKEVNAAN
jgi:type IV secretory pathway VirB10-like protein